MIICARWNTTVRRCMAFCCARLYNYTPCAYARYTAL